MPELVQLTVAVRASFLVAMQEFTDEGRGGDATMVGTDLAEWNGRWATDEGFAAYVGTVVRDREEDAPRRPGWVPCTTLWWIDGSAYLGRIAIRHRLTPALRGVGGHIGYDVRPSAPALVTCDDTNVGSRKVIEANGGVLSDQRG